MAGAKKHSKAIVCRRSDGGDYATAYPVFLVGNDCRYFASGAAMTLHAPNLKIKHIWDIDHKRKVARCLFVEGNIYYVYWVPIYDFREG